MCLLSQALGQEPFGKALDSNQPFVKSIKSFPHFPDVSPTEMWAELHGSRQVGGRSHEAVHRLLVFNICGMLIKVNDEPKLWPRYAILFQPEVKFLKERVKHVRNI